MSHLHHKVSALVDGELSPSARSRALAHARRCPQCRREIVETVEVKRRLHKLAPVEVSDDLLLVVASGARARPPSTYPDRSRVVRLALTGVGSLSVAIVVLAYVVGAPAPVQTRIVSPSVEEFAAEFADGSGHSPLSDPAVGLTLPDDSGAATPIGFDGTDDVWGRTSVGSAPGGYDAIPGTGSGDDRAALRWLHKAWAAPQRLAFHGWRVVKALMPAGMAQSVVEVTHNPGQGTTYAEPSTGPEPSEWFVADADSEAGADPASSATGADSDLTVAQLAAGYDLRSEGVDVVDGRRAQVVSMSRSGQVSTRFWIDEATGLLLRKTMYVDGLLVRWSGYSSIDMRRHGFMQHLPPERPAPPTTRLSRSAAALLADEGWVCPERLSGDFRLLALRQLESREGVVQADYGDGLSAVSMFEQQGSLDATTLDGFRPANLQGRAVYVRDGLPTVVVWEAGARVFTLVTDVPAQSVGDLVTHLPGDAEPAHHGPMSRIGHGLTRLASAVTP